MYVKEKAFKEIKNIMAEKKMLLFPKINVPFDVHTV